MPATGDCFGEAGPNLYFYFISRRLLLAMTSPPIEGIGLEGASIGGSGLAGAPIGGSGLAGFLRSSLYAKASW